MTTIAARTLVEGEGRGPIVQWTVPLSFWGGLDPRSGRVIDRSHPACGDSVAGAVLVMPSGRGSSSSSSILAEAIRRNTAPAAIVLETADPIIVVGALVARRLYGRTCPVVVCDPAHIRYLARGFQAHVVAPRGHRAEIILVDGERMRHCNQPKAQPGSLE